MKIHAIQETLNLIYNANWTLLCDFLFSQLSLSAFVSIWNFNIYITFKTLLLSDIACCMEGRLQSRATLYTLTHWRIDSVTGDFPKKTNENNESYLSITFGEVYSLYRM